MLCNLTAKFLMILISISGLFLSKKKPFINSPSSATQGKDKKPKYSENDDDDDDDYEPTGMLSEFKREAGLMSDVDKSVSKSMIKRPENSYMQQSLVASFMEQEENLSLLGEYFSRKLKSTNLKKIWKCFYVFFFFF